MKRRSNGFAVKRAHLLRRLPPLEEILGGSLFERRRRCGNPSCHCAKEEGHRAVYLGIRLPSGKIEQISVRTDWVPLVRKWSANYKRVTHILHEISALNRQWFREEWQRRKPVAGGSRR